MRRSITLSRIKVLTRVTLLTLVVALALAQERPTFRVKVDMVVLSFQITDNKGKYINGLKPKDFRVLEDGIPQKIATFGEGSKPPMPLNEDGTVKQAAAPDSSATGTGPVTGPANDRLDALVGTNVFVLFDTSNYMYRGF